MGNNDCSVTRPVMERVRQLSQPDQPFVKRHLLARAVSCVAAAIFAAVDLCVHTVAVVTKLPFAVVRLVIPPSKEVLPETFSLSHVGRHALRVAVFAVSILVTPPVALVSPRYAVAFHEKLGILPTTAKIEKVATPQQQPVPTFSETEGEAIKCIQHSSESNCESLDNQLLSYSDSLSDGWEAVASEEKNLLGAAEKPNTRKTPKSIEKTTSSTLVTNTEEVPSGAEVIECIEDSSESDCESLDDELLSYSDSLSDGWEAAASEEQNLLEAAEEPNTRKAPKSIEKTTNSTLVTDVEEVPLAAEEDGIYNAPSHSPGLISTARHNIHHVVDALMNPLFNRL